VVAGLHRVEMLLGRPPFVADDVTALLFQIIKMGPASAGTERAWPAASGGDGAAARPEQATVDRFSTIRAFSRAFATAAFGQPADLTPAPFLLSSLSPRQREHRAQRGASREHARQPSRDPNPAG